MEFLLTVGTTQLQNHLPWVRDQLLPGIGGRWVNLVNGRHYGYITLEKPEGCEAETISASQFASRIGEMEARVSWGDSFELTLNGETAFYITLTPSNEVARADRRARWKHLGRVRELRPLEVRLA